MGSVAGCVSSVSDGLWEQFGAWGNVRMLFYHRAWPWWPSPRCHLAAVMCCGRGQRAVICSEGHRARQDLSCCRGQSVAGLGQRCWSREGIAVTASPCSEQQQLWSCPFSPLFLMCFEGLDPQPHGGNCSCLGRARSLDDPLHFTGPFV